MSFASAVKALRLMAGLSQIQLAERSGSSQSAISQYEMGLRAPDPLTVGRLSTALGLPPEESMALLAVAGYADETWQEQASQDLEAYINDSTTPTHAIQN